MDTNNENVVIEFMWCDQIKGILTSDANHSPISVQLPGVKDPIPYAAFIDKYSHLYVCRAIKAHVAKKAATQTQVNQ